VVNGHLTWLWPQVPCGPTLVEAPEGVGLSNHAGK
jgi:hypothetical protein